MSHLTYPESMVIGLIQGVTELFPVSSLGHAVLIPALIGARSTAWRPAWAACATSRCAEAAQARCGSER
jgi:undecaprenyl pyrophosphate phosphatase UppP